MSDLVSLLEFKKHLNIAENETSKDRMFMQMITQASDLVRARTRRTWQVQSDQIEKFTPHVNSQIIQVRYYPIVSVSYVKENDTELTVNQDYYVHENVGQIKRTGDTHWTTLDDGVEVKYTGGEVAPEGLKLNVLEWLAAVSRERTKTYTTNEGIEASVAITSVPDWVTKGFMIYHKVLV